MTEQQQPPSKTFPFLLKRLKEKDGVAYHGSPRMDQTLVASIRKSLEAKSTAELRQAYEGPDKATRSAEELEAIRQLLDERQPKNHRAVLAVASALIGTIAATFAWWQGVPGVIVPLVGIGGAILGFAAWYIPGLFGQA